MLMIKLNSMRRRIMNPNTITVIFDVAALLTIASVVALIKFVEFKMETIKHGDKDHERNMHTKC